MNTRYYRVLPNPSPLTNHNGLISFGPVESVRLKLYPNVIPEIKHLGLIFNHSLRWNV